MNEPHELSGLETKIARPDAASHDAMMRTYEAFREAIPLIRLDANASSPPSPAWGEG